MRPGMRTLVLLRHAKSDWPPGVADVDRPLADRGRADAPEAGRAIGAMLPGQGRILVSPALRTLQTWALAAPQIGLPEDAAIVESRLYEAEASTIVEVIAETSDEVDCLVVIAHNPGLESLAHRLAGAADPAALAAMSVKFPTSAIARFDWSGSWAHPDVVRLVAFVVARG